MVTGLLATVAPTCVHLSDQSLESSCKSVTGIKGFGACGPHTGGTKGELMKNVLAIAVLLFGFCLTANADVWKWVDALGKTYYVDTMKPIYAWIDEDGKSHYSDTPDHEGAVSVVFVWHSTGGLTDLGENQVEAQSDSDAPADETDEERADREDAEAYYCKRVTEIYESYLHAPRLYSTDDNGEREFLTEEESAATIAETEAKMNELCR